MVGQTGGRFTPSADKEESVDKGEGLSNFTTAFSLNINRPIVTPDSLLLLG